MIVGIDLGTTNSAVGVWRDGRPALLPNALGDLLTPSAVSIGDDGAVLVGMAARERAATRPKQTATAFKRHVGTQQITRLGGRDYTAEDLSALVLASLKADAEAALCEPVTGAVVTVPAYFNDRQRRATRRAGELAGLKIDRLINEPTAAALAFGIETREEREPFLVFDLGGGTFDVSIVELFDGIVEVRATAGDNRLGGEDFTALLAAMARPLLDPDRRLDGADPIRVSALLREAAERARRALTDSEQATVEMVLDGERFAAEVTGAAFEEQAKGLIARLRDPVLRSLRDSNIRADALSEVVLVGGATRMPIVRRAITRMFGRFPDTTVHPDHAVALGAAVQAGLLARDAALDEIRLTDVCPFTLGVERAERDGRGSLRTGLFSPIIDRNTPLPVSRVSSYGTVADQQRQLAFHVYQGEAREVAGNVKLGTLNVKIPPRPAGEIWCECRFSYDVSGLLEVDVKVPATGESHNLVILDEADAPSAAELEKRREALAALKIHPRDETANAALLERAARCYESFTGERRDRVGELIAAWETVLAGQQLREIAEMRERIAAALDELDGERYL